MYDIVITFVTPLDKGITGFLTEEPMNFDLEKVEGMLYMLQDSLPTRSSITIFTREDEQIIPGYKKAWPAQVTLNTKALRNSVMAAQIVQVDELNV